MTDLRTDLARGTANGGCAIKVIHCPVGSSDIARMRVHYRTAAPRRGINKVNKSKVV